MKKSDLGYLVLCLIWFILVKLLNLDKTLYTALLFLSSIVYFAFVYFIKSRKTKNNKLIPQKIEHNEITKKIINLIREQLDENLPNVKKEEYEENGKVYYMNGQNGTYFDWTFNGRLPYFMVFYKDGSCGAIKVHIMTNGNTKMYFYKYGEKVPFITKKFKFDKNEILKLAIILIKNADDKGIADSAINDINTNLEITNDEIKEFEKTKIENESAKNKD